MQDHRYPTYRTSREHSRAPPVVARDSAPIRHIPQPMLYLLPRLGIERPCTVVRGHESGVVVYRSLEKGRVSTAGDGSLRRGHSNCISLWALDRNILDE